MATFRKRQDKWQVQVRRSGFPNLSKTFFKKSDAHSWARQKEASADIQNDEMSCNSVLADAFGEVRSNAPNNAMMGIECWRRFFGPMLNGNLIIELLQFYLHEDMMQCR